MLSIDQVNFDGEELTIEDAQATDGKLQLSVFYGSAQGCPYTRVNIVLEDNNIHVEQFQVDDYFDNDGNIIDNKQVHTATTVVKVVG